MRLLFWYSVIGCPDLKLPPQAWYRREGDSATVGCENVNEIWTLTCADNQWEGVVGECAENGKIM